MRAQNQAYWKVSESWVSKDHLQENAFGAVSQIHQILIHLQFDKKETGQSSQSKSLWNSKGEGGREGENAKIHLLLLSEVLQQLTRKCSSSWKPVNALLKRFATQKTDFQIWSIISSFSRARTRIFAWAYLSWANSVYTDNWLPLSQIFLLSSQGSANTTISTTQQYPEIRKTKWLQTYSHYKNAIVLIISETKAVFSE